VLLNIWATWCAPCREEMPRIERLYQELGPQGLAVVAVSIDNPGMTDAIREFRKEMGLTFDVLHDESGRIRDDYQTTGVPETFLIDRAGVVRRRLIGASWTVDDQRPLLRELIAEQAR
jgi:thiol-disulfide isomerase/thioredoxin